MWWHRVWTVSCGDEHRMSWAVHQLRCIESILNLERNCADFIWFSYQNAIFVPIFFFAPICPSLSLSSYARASAPKKLYGIFCFRFCASTVWEINLIWLCRNPRLPFSHHLFALLFIIFFFFFFRCFLSRVFDWCDCKVPICLLCCNYLVWLQESEEMACSQPSIAMNKEFRCWTPQTIGYLWFFLCTLNVVVLVGGGRLHLQIAFEEFMAKHFCIFHQFGANIKYIWNFISTLWHWFSFWLLFYFPFLQFNIL